MIYLQGGILLSAAILFFIIAFYAFLYSRSHGALDISFLALMLFIWSMGSFLEGSAHSLSAKLFFRNMQQIGVFFAPWAFLSFAASFCRNISLYRNLRLLLFVPTVSVFLSLTDVLHHLMYKSIFLVPDRYFENLLIVERTVAGKILVIVSVSMIAVALLLILLGFSGFSRYKKKQSYLFFGAAGFAIVFYFVRAFVYRQTGIMIDLTIVCIPPAVTIFYSVFRYRFFHISPIARDKVFEVINQSILVLDKNGIIVDINARALDLARGIEGIYGEPIGQFIGDYYKPGEEYFDKLQNKESKGSLDVCLIINGKQRYFSLYYFPLFSAGKVRVGAVVIFIDISDRKKSELRLIEDAERDPLTGLLNRRGLAEAYAKLRSEDFLPACIMVLDLDDFKGINDSMGHTVGDTVLSEFAHVLITSLRDKDLIARFGGDEFVIVLPGTDYDKASVAANRIANKLSERPLLVCNDNSCFDLSVSIGIYELKDTDVDIFTAIDHADKSMYDQKRKKKYHIERMEQA